MIGQKIAHYRITAAIGAGGMGEVYRATDTRLGRDVALKVLPPEMASMPERLDRFRREAKALAALDHPGIVTVHSVEEADGVHFLTMQLVEGESLDRVIGRGGMQIDRILSIAGALAEAIAAAHDKGIIHRDLKPANVMVSTDGRVKVLDFGLARMSITEPTGGSQLSTDLRTRDGVVMGTAAYMSPEQITGRELDHRTDIFSLGIILYEMTSGRRPFRGSSSAELASAILRDAPRSLGELRGGLPESLQRAIERCLEKSATNRFSSARELSEALRASSRASSSMETAVTPTVRPPKVDSDDVRSEEGFRVAVLPFKYTGADSDLSALRDGLPEEIVTGLSRFRYLSVVASSSAARLAGVDGDERAPNTKPRARYVVEGSVRGGGSAVRVSAQLVDTQTGAQLWSETYRQDLHTSSDFAVQEDIAARIVATVADSYGVLVHSMRDAMRKKDDANLTPAEWQFQYFAYREQITPANHAALKSRLEKVAEQVDRQSDLWACLAQIYVDEYAFGFPGHDGKSLDRALAAARRGVELDRANQFAMVALAQTHFFRQDLAAFGPAAARAMALNPLNTDALGILGLEIVHTGEFERGTAIVRRAMELNANHAGWMHFAPLWDYFHKGEYEQALECANRVDVPGLFWPFLVMASACGHLGRTAEAKAAVRDLLALDPEFAAHARSNIESWHFASGLLEPLLDGLRKAGLSIPPNGASDLPRIGAVATGSKPGADSGEVRGEEGFWVVVLPFRYSGGNADLTALAEGLSEEIVTGLSRFAYLHVVARGSTLRFTSEATDIRTVGKELGARYVIEGSLRQAGSLLRVSVQLLDASSGGHLWAETYDRSFRPEEIFSLQDELVPRIVSTVADQHGVLVHGMAEVLRNKPAEQLTPYEAVLSVFGFHERMSAEEHAVLRDVLERVVREYPDQGNCWAMLETLYCDEYMFGFNVRPDPLGRALVAAQRAVEAAPTSNLACQALAQALFFRHEFASFRPLAERTIALNPMDGATVAFMGILIACSGEWDRGCEVAEDAMQLNPHFAGWYRLASLFNAYRQHDYRAAVDIALRINIPGYFWTLVMSAAAYGQLGELAAAQRALRELLSTRADFDSTARAELGGWFDDALVEHVIDGLRMAGLEDPTAKAASHSLESSTSAQISGEVRSEEGFWVAVLPFKYSGGNTDLTALAEGLSEEIVTGLSRFSYLRVIARSSTSRYARESVDVRTAGKELGARYVMEGSLRQAGTKLRLAAQLVDAVSGAHLWAESYERTFSPEAVFELQDDLVPRIVSTVADVHGVLPRSMSGALRSRAPEELSPYEAVLRSFGYSEQLTAEEHAEVRSALERAVQATPANADALAMLSTLYADEYKQGFNAKPDPLGRALDAARRAVAAAPSNHLAYHVLAEAHFFRKEFPAFRIAAERALALNPMDGNTTAFMGILLAYAGDWERGVRLTERAMELNPNHPGWYQFVFFNDALRREDYREALEVALKFNMPTYFFTHAALATAYGHLGDLAAARNAIRELLAQKPDFHLEVREELGKWLDPDLLERNLEGLRKAGLEIPDDPSTVAPASREASGAQVSIAVLPFSDMSAAKDQEYLCEGMAEEIMNALVRIDGIHVASRTSAFRAGRNGGDLSSIARALSVNHVLEGSVRTSGNRLRVTAQLTDVASGYQLWSERFDREDSDVFAIQDEIAAGVVDAVRTRLAPGTQTVHARPHVHNLEAYRSYLKGRHLRGAEDYFGARAAFEEAVRLDPAHAPSWTGLAEITVLSAHMGMILPRSACTAARKMLGTAKDLQGESADGLHVEAFASYLERRWDAMEMNWRRALELQPDHVLALGSFAISLCARQRLEEALPFFERAREADPLASFPYTLAGWGLLMCGRPEEAMRNLEDALTFEKDDASAIGALCLANVVQGKFDQAIEAGERGVALTGRQAPFFLGILGWALATSGREGEARSILEELRALPAGSPTAVSEAWLLGALGEMDEAFAVLSQAEEEFQGMVSYTGLPGFDSLRSDERFAALLERLELSPA